MAKSALVGADRVAVHTHRHKGGVRTHLITSSLGGLVGVS